MDAEFWHQKWRDNEIGFHEKRANPRLTQNLALLKLKENARLFLPLCGKTLDIGWLLAQGYKVAGAELSEMAVQQLFKELGVEPVISASGVHRLYSAPGLHIFAGDFFNLTAVQLGPVDAVYDRAALVALPANMRRDYTAHLRSISRNAPQLLVCFDYDQSCQPGPPFSISSEEVRQHYARHYNIRLLESISVSGGLKGKCPALETVWLLNTPD